MTPRQAQLLRIMSDEDEWLTWCGREVWVGSEKTNTDMAYRMLRRMWIKHPTSHRQDEDYLTFEITTLGKEALDGYLNGGFFCPKCGTVYSKEIGRGCLGCNPKK